MSSAEPKRIRQLRLAICKQIPKFPNNRESLAALEAKSLGAVLIDYINWGNRFVPPRPRRVTIEPTLTADSRWKRLSGDVKALLKKARDGADLGPYLSLRVARHGFTLKSREISQSADRWEDKDFFLNVMGYHHFHLGPSIEAAGHAARTDEVLFAQVTRDAFTAVGLFDHSVFESKEAASQSMTAERDRLWRLTEQRNSFGRAPGIYIDHPITNSGHSLQHTHLAAHFARQIYFVDPKLDDLASRAELFPDLPHAVVKAMKLTWNFHYLDLGLCDRTSGTFFVLQKGPM
ncbi:hypothetical protein ABL840_01720 [Variovorax sp. NFACC27]|uniref:hypothetical protein n=1 Tax=unclassified Variovorax TaxID=663243 RepID=UPI0008971D32|nr:hypothetical protein SAMN03159371_02006 [Variovorax sp. NFACC28]SEG43198.1 hypothetical protein SAMN03159365_02087 [Variovorax sp. NFACC29]SFC30684.1 hypothetical protein SAMN03159379_02023 [Variovorax sp. NFACC26]SFG60421.1 hypothetical protein SAMN03159447_03997 [Variovorax sp. NFACC27]